MNFLAKSSTCVSLSYLIFWHHLALLALMFLLWCILILASEMKHHSGLPPKASDCSLTISFVESCSCAHPFKTEILWLSVLWPLLFSVTQFPWNISGIFHPIGLISGSCGVAAACGSLKWDLSSPSRDWTRAMAVKTPNLNHYNTRS